MENPNSLANPAQGAMINGDVLVGNPGGRPPEDIVLDGNLNSLERPGSPILVVDQPGCKRGRMDDGLMEDLIDPEDGLGNLMTEGDRRTTMVMEDDGRTKHLMQGEPGVEARDPKALYGPWMQVTNRRRRNDTNQSATNLNKGTGEIKNPMGSRFAALFESLTVMEDGNEEEPLGGFEGGIEGAKISTPNGNSQKAGNLHNLEINIDSSQVQEGRKNSGKETKTKSKSNILDNSVEGKNTGYTYRHQSTKSVASKGKVEVAKSSLNPEKHTAVRMSGEEGIQEPRILKGGNKVTLKTKKKDGGGTLKTTLAQQLSPLLSDLENSVSGEGERFGDTHTGVVPEISQVDWQANSAFEQPKRIEAIQPPRGELGMDRARWRWDDKFIFSTMSAYKYLIGSPNADRTFKWKQIWGLKIPQRIRTFMWLVAHERLMTNAERVRRHIANTTRIEQDSKMKWSLPTAGWVKLNVDASVEPNTSRAGIGGVIRDDRGSWRAGFARFIGRCPVLLAEMWAIYEGLLRAWSLGYRKVELESDSLEATHIIKRESETLNKSALVASIRKMLNKDWHVIVHHVNRNRNHVADKLSRRGREGQRLTNLMLEAPEDISSIVMEEKSVHYSMINATGVEERDLPFDPGGCNV
ncbi:hypothetical protein V6N11_010017 [Hibiscus sabdariffa]|uniref:RNase H type-1 domain-containing protein n=1 Tax=Hibiscus sabdariffa TaxID=183260 RepID=A0ABR2PDY7_9ROSI